MIKCCPGGVVGHGPIDSGVMCIGIAPGQREMATLKPFQGPSGQLLDAVLEAVGWSRDKVFCTNCCCSFHNEPTPEQLATCAPRLVSEIQACATHAPNNKLLIIALGKIPAEYLFKMQFGKIQGAMLDVSDLFPGPAQVIGLASFHPSGILQSNDKPDQQNDFATSLVYDLEKIKPLMTGEAWRNGFAGRLEGHIKPGDFELINNPERAQKLLRDHIDRTRTVVIDIETDYDKDSESADPYGNILCVGLRYTDSDSGIRSIAVITQAGLVGLEWPSDLRYVGHNMYGFDAIAMDVKFGAKLPICGDTYVKSYVKDERTKRGLHKLKNRSRELVGAGFYEDEREHVAGMNLYTYNANDVYYTDELDEELERRFTDTDRALYYDLLLPSANMYSESQRAGANIDVLKLAEVSAEFIQEMHSLEASLIARAQADQFYGNHTGIFNLNSPIQVLKYLQRRGHKIESTGKDVIEFLTVLDTNGQHVADPWIGDLLKYRRYVKAHAVYCVGTQRQIKFDHKVHPKPLIPGTRTGRPSIIDPPVNTLPHTRSIGELSKVRAMYIPDDPDNDILMEFDYSQIELYILQWLSGDANLLEDLLTPWHVTGEPNYHSRTCELIIGGVVCPIHGVKTIPSCPVCRKWEFDRDAQKHVNFGIPYGESAMGLMRPPPIGTGQSLEVCQSYIDAWYARNTDVLKWQRRIQQQLVDHGEVTTPFNRTFRTPLVCNAKQLRQIINAPVQSAASDYTLTSALELRTALPKYRARMLWTTYDSILINALERYKEDIADMVVKVMTKPRTPGGPSVPVEYKYGKNLYEVSEVH